MLHVMRRLWPVVALLVLACGSSQPVEPLTGSYAVVFDSSFMGAVRSGPSAAFPASEIESYVGLGYKLKPGHLFRVTIDNLQDCGAFAAQVCAAPGDIQSAGSASASKCS